MKCGGTPSIHGSSPVRRSSSRPAAERPPPFSPGQPGTAAAARAAAPVVADADVQRALGAVHPDVDGGGVRVLGNVGQRLGHSVVGGDLRRAASAAATIRAREAVSAA